MLRHLTLTLFLVLFAVPTVWAQDAQQITFDDAVRIALKQNVTLLRSKNFVEQQASLVQDRRMAFSPNLTFSAGAGQNFGRQFIQSESRIVEEKNESFRSSVSSNITLFSGFRNVSLLNAAQLDLEAQDLDYQRQEQTVIFNVMSQYLTLIERGEQISIQEENLESQRQQLAQIEEFVNVGSRPISDLYQQQAQAANAELTLLEAQRLYQLAEVALINTLQLDPFGAYEFMLPEISDSELVPAQYDVRDMLQTAFGTRADLKSQESRITASLSDIKASRASYFPNISLGFGYGSSWNSAIQDVLRDAGGNIVPDANGDPIFSNVSFSDQLDRNRGGNVSLSLSVPIFDRLSTKNATQRAKIQYDNAKLDLENLQQNIALQVRQAYLDYLTADKSLEVTEKQLISAEQALTADQERYNVGAATLVELSQSRASFVQAQSDQNQARFDFIFQKKLIDYYLGNLNPSEDLF